MLQAQTLLPVQARAELFKDKVYARPEENQAGEQKPSTFLPHYPWTQDQGPTNRYAVSVPPRKYQRQNNFEEAVAKYLSALEWPVSQTSDQTVTWHELAIDFHNFDRAKQETWHQCATALRAAATKLIRKATYIQLKPTASRNLSHLGIRNPSVIGLSSRPNFAGGAATLEVLAAYVQHLHATKPSHFLWPGPPTNLAFARVS